MKTAKTKKSSAAQRGRVMRVCYCTSLKFLREKSRAELTHQLRNAEKEKLREKTDPTKPAPCAKIMKRGWKMSMPKPYPNIRP
jgi:hypothetical protein